MGYGTLPSCIFHIRKTRLSSASIQAFGALTPQSVLDYFAQSPFYDPTSNNAVLRMQTQYSVAA